MTYLENHDMINFNILNTVIGNSKYGKPFRELLAGVKQRGNRIELALEFPSEHVVGQDESPSL